MKNQIPMGISQLHVPSLHNIENHSKCTFFVLVILTSACMQCILPYHPGLPGDRNNQGTIYLLQGRVMAREFWKKSGKFSDWLKIRNLVKSGMFSDGGGTTVQCAWNDCSRLLIELVWLWSCIETLQWKWLWYLLYYIPSSLILRLFDVQCDVFRSVHHFGFRKADNE